MPARPIITACGPIAGAVAAALRSWATVIAGEGDEPLSTLEVASRPETDGLLIDTRLRIDETLLARLPALRIVASAAVGYDNIDLAACKQHKVALSNGRGALNDAVADLALTLVLMCRREIQQAALWAKSGAWQNGPAPLAHDLAGATLGIYGLGAIGLALAKRATACGMRVEYHNRRRRNDDEATGATYRSLPELAARADVLVILTPLSSETRGSVSAELLARMRPSAYVVNVARGPIVDTAALHAALAAGKLAGAALDVTDPEPLPAEHALFALPNVVIVPHIGSATLETRERMSMLAARNLAAFFRGEPLLTPIS